MDITKEIYDYIVSTFSIELDEEFDADVHLFDYGYVDSFDAMKIIADLETRYNIQITQQDLMLSPMNTINELSDVVKAKLDV